MSPTIVLKDGQPVMTVGAAGGPRIISQSLLTIVQYLDLGMSLSDAVANPRFHHQWRPDRLMVEDNFDANLIEQLKKRGHEIQKLKYMGVTQAIAYDAQEGQFIGVHDPGVKGKAAGLPGK
jgi:gamma-glutamyltranspeptidase/glutathione hydrolase